MTFDEAYELLNGQEDGAVTEVMKEWHPAILAQMLGAVDLAKHQRYPLDHPDWTAAVKRLAENPGFIAVEP